MMLAATGPKVAEVASGGTLSDVGMIGIMVMCVVMLVNLVFDYLDKVKRTEILDALQTAIAKNWDAIKDCAHKVDDCINKVDVVHGVADETLEKQRDMWYVRDRLEEAIKVLGTNLGRLADVLRDMSQDHKIAQEKTLNRLDGIDNAIKDMDERVRKLGDRR